MATATYTAKWGTTYAIQYDKDGFWVREGSRIVAHGGRPPMVIGKPLNEAEREDKMLLQAQEAIEKGDFLRVD